MLQSMCEEKGLAVKFLVGAHQLPRPKSKKMATTEPSQRDRHFSAALDGDTFIYGGCDYPWSEDPSSFHLFKSGSELWESGSASGPHPPKGQSYSRSGAVTIRCVWECATSLGDVDSHNCFQSP